MKTKDKEVADKITELGHSLEKNITKGQSPQITLPVRGLSNVHFDKTSNLLRMGRKTSKRSFLNIAHARKFMQTALIAGKCREFVSRGKTASIRELYYQLKHTIADTKENTFDDQSESDPLIVDLETSLGVLREELHLKA
ncbi:DNA topoisomerase VI, partial [Patescibacteria group bacterium]|nr:DNA topoisomerase VI [Patescibacteria group bacterium]